MYSSMNFDMLVDGVDDATDSISATKLEIATRTKSLMYYNPTTGEIRPATDDDRARAIAEAARKRAAAFIATPGVAEAIAEGWPQPRRWRPGYVGPWEGHAKARTGPY